MKVGEGRTAVELKADKLHEGLAVSLTGGRSHIGAVVLAADGQVRVLRREHHRDEELAIPLAKAVAAATKSPVLCYCGVHIDDATPEEIAQIRKNAEEAGKKLVAEMRK